MNEEHEGRRKNELTWKIHRIHWEKNRFIYDLMYVRKVMSRELVCCAAPTLVLLEGCVSGASLLLLYPRAGKYLG